MPLIPDSGRRGQTLVLTVSNASRYHVIPSLEFRHAGSPSTWSSGVEVVGSGRWVPPTSCEYDLRVAPNAPLGDYTAYFFRNQLAGTFTVLDAAAGAPPRPAVPAAGSAGTPPDLARRILEAEARIFEAEADVLEAIAQAAADGARDPAWLTAAAHKECAVAHVIEALAEKERVLADTASGDPGGNGGNGGGGNGNGGGIHLDDEDIEGGQGGTRKGPRSGPQGPCLNDGDGDGLCKSGCTVLLHNGEERLDRVDLSIPGRGDVEFVMRRRYRSRLEYDGPLGFGWFFTYDEGLEVLPSGDVVRTNGGGHIDTWTRNADGSYSAPRGHFRVLRQLPDGSFELRDADGFKRCYHAGGFLARYVDRFGNEMLFERDARGNLNLVVDPYGRGIELEYLSLPNEHGQLVDRLVCVRDFDGREVRYSYLHGDLVEVRTPVVTGTSTGNDFPQGRTERYTYTSRQAHPELNHKLLSVTRPEEVASGGPPALAWTYGTDPGDPLTFAKVLTETVGGRNATGVWAGGTTTFVYERLNEGVPLGNPDVVRGSVVVTESNGNRTQHFGNENRCGILTYRFTRGLRAGEPAFFAERSFYNQDDQLVRRIDPEGNEVLRSYDRSGQRSQQQNVIEHRQVADPRRGGGEDLVTRWTYEPLFNRVSTVTDPRGNARQFQPPLGAPSRGRYTTRFFYDYQEGSDPIPDAADFGIDLSGVARGRGDLNDDGRVDQVAGNLVRVEEPAVTLLQGSNEALRIGSTTQQVVRQTQWNDGGQLSARIDEEGNVTEYDYYPEDDPDGDGVTVQTGFLPLTKEPLGYLRAVVVDARTSPRRRPTAPAPAALETTYAYDVLGNVTSIRDPRGVVTTFEVNQLREQVRVRRGADVSHAVAQGELVTGEDPLENDTESIRDRNGRLISLRVKNDPPGLFPYVERRWVYDILDHPIEASVTVDPATTLVTRYGYEPGGQRDRVVWPAGNEERTVYDERDLRFTVTRGFGTPEASTVRFDYDSNGNLARRHDAEDKDGDGQPEATVFTYDGFDRLSKVTDALGNTESFELDVASNVVRARVHGHPAGQPRAQPVPLSDVAVRHDELGRPYETGQRLFVSDGFQTARSVELRDYDDDKVVTTRQEYDASSRPTFFVADGGAVTEAVHDGAGRVVDTVDALGNRQTTVYNRGSNPIEVTSLKVSPGGVVGDETFETRYVYDQLGRLVRATDNAGQTTRLGYDSRDNLVFRSDPEGPLTQDPLGLFSGQINGPGNTRTYVYDGLDRLRRQVCDLRVGGTGSGQVDTSNPFNPSGQVSLSYDWNKNSLLAAIVDADGNRTRYRYDALDRRVRQINAPVPGQPDEVTKWIFDRDDNVREVTDPNGTVCTKTYDALSRLTGVTVDRAGDVQGTAGETFEHDGLCRLTLSSDDNGGRRQVCERVYDSLHRLLEERFNGQAVSSTFSGDGERLRCVYPGGRIITQKHDVLHRVTSIHDASAPIAESAWIGPGLRELRRRNRNGTTLSFLDDAGAASGYDAVQRITRLRVLDAAGKPIVDRGYAYNRAGMRTSETRYDDGGLKDTYTYDSTYRVVRSELDQGRRRLVRDLESVRYVYDPVGNRRQVDLVRRGAGPKRQDYTVNQLNEYTTRDGVARTHSRNGNLVHDGKRRYVYDYKNRLVTVLDEAGRTVAEYLYYADNRRARKDIPGETPVETLFFYDGWRVCEEQNAAGATETTYVYSPVYIDEIVQLERTADHPLGAGELYLHQNARADVVAVTDGSGAVVERRFYDDFGNACDEDKQPVVASAVGNPYGFQGRRLDPETGLYYFRNRYFDPETGRFLQRDPVWDSGNLGGQYSIAGNGPVSGADAWGLQTPGQTPGNIPTSVHPDRAGGADAYARYVRYVEKSAKALKKKERGERTKSKLKELEDMRRIREWSCEQEVHETSFSECDSCGKLGWDARIYRELVIFEGEVDAAWRSIRAQEAGMNELHEKAREWEDLWLDEKRPSHNPHRNQIRKVAERIEKAKADFESRFGITPGEAEFRPR